MNHLMGEEILRTLSRDCLCLQYSEKEAHIPCLHTLIGFPFHLLLIFSSLTNVKRVTRRSKAILDKGPRVAPADHIQCAGYCSIIKSCLPVTPHKEYCYGYQDTGVSELLNPVQITRRTKLLGDLAWPKAYVAKM